MAGAMRRIAQGNWRSRSDIPSYLSTHPAMEERIQYLDDLARQTKKKKPENMGKPSIQGILPDAGSSCR
jgi:predicted Zn-dependent protease